MKGRVLVIDDEKNITLVITAMLEKIGFEAVAYNDGIAALKHFSEDGDYDAVVTDLKLPGIDGMEIMSKIKSLDSDLPVVMITAFGTVEAAVNALKYGAFDFVTKPFDKDELIAVIKKAVHTSQLRRKDSKSNLTTIVAENAQMKEILKLVSKVATSPSTALIYGESGTGKELVAFEIHRQSSRSELPFIRINCAAIPANLIESELFGYEKGAFTGAVTSKPGRFELADGGTLFLDEIAEMPLEMQAKLLRVLQEQEFERVGGVSTTKVDVRIIAATNKDLEAEVSSGRFREDLFYRLNVVPFYLPPLRERPEDIELLVQSLTTQINQRLKKSVDRVSDDLIELIKAYSWPGNVRQLENVLERMVLMSDSAELGSDDLPQDIVVKIEAEKQGVSAEDREAVANSELGQFKQIVRKRTQSLEKDLIARALDECSGNVTRAAEILGLSRKGLQNKIKELGLK